MSMHTGIISTQLTRTILSEIFSHLDENLGQYTAVCKNPSLEALARTCKTFHEPAMRLLWAKLYGMTPLLSCVPRLHQLIYGSSPRGIRDRWYHSIEPLSEPETHQFLRHAARVRSLNISFHDYDLFHLHSILPLETCVFPGLLSLTFRVIPPQNKYIYLFLSPTLRRCVLAYVHPDLKSIVTRLPALEELCITGPLNRTADKLALLSDSICLCKRLVTLSCPPVDWAAWKHLSSLPSLFGVEICRPLYHAPTGPLYRDMANFGPCVNFTRLSFKGNTTSYAIAVMQHSEFPSLKDFQILVDVLPWAVSEQLCRALSQCNERQTLETIAILSHGIGLPEPSNNSLTVVPYLFSFTQLRNLRLSPNCCIHIDNDLLLEAVSSWPYLRVLEIASRQMPPAVTFRGLFAALRLCPHLHTLAIFMDAVNIDIDPKAESFQHTALQSFNVAWSEVADAEAVAHIIFSMLPCINHVGQHWQTRRQLLINLWDDVNGHLRVLNGGDFIVQVPEGESEEESYLFLD
ncbi:hypothetical protein EDB19DRAFT_2041103 [Suillus lakei]|nr:hypothetical protein EDB19DRAFT_2041103 [Suillus lakei]